MNLIFDLDGTLIDSRLRLYRLFQRLVPESKLSHDSYWYFKRKKISNEAILAKEFGYETPAINRFVSEWMNLIEAPELLALDKNFPGMHAGLCRLRKQARLHVCTARQHRQLVFEQLDSMRLLNFFDSVMVTEQKRDKEDLVAALSDLGPHDWIIGDTGKDIQVGKSLNIKTCAVLSGFLSKESIRGYDPDLILQSAADFQL